MRPLSTALLVIAETQDMLFTRRQAIEVGIAPGSLDERVGATIMRPLPTVYAAFTGELTTQQRLRAAVLYGRIGGGIDISALGGLAACHLHGLKAAARVARVELLVPHKHQPAAVGFVDVRRATLPVETWQLSGLPLCSPARAVVDATRRMTDIDDVRTVAAEAVQRNKCTVDALRTELAHGGSAGSRLMRSVLAEISDGVRSAAEAWFQQLVAASTLPQPLWNADLLDQAGAWLARPDAIWPEAALVAEVESREWHLSPASWAATMKRTNLLGRLGFDVQQFPPSRIRREAAAVTAESPRRTPQACAALLRESLTSTVTIRSADSSSAA